MLQLTLIPHQVGTDLIHQRAVDGYVNATAMCKAVGKLFADYRRLQTTEAFLRELEGSMGIPIDQLIFTTATGVNEQRGTWVHPHVAINLGQWCSPKFAVAVSQWVHDWFTGAVRPAALPYHIRRYMANRAAIPAKHFSILNEMIFAVIAPMEEAGYTLPENMLPDISLGRMFCKWLREERSIDPGPFPKYQHHFEDGRIVQARAYPNVLLADVREHIHGRWIPNEAERYFGERDPKALEFIPLLLPPPVPELSNPDVVHSKFHRIKEMIHNLPDSKIKP